MILAKTASCSGWHSSCQTQWLPLVLKLERARQRFERPKLNPYQILRNKFAHWRFCWNTWTLQMSSIISLSKQAQALSWVWALVAVNMYEPETFFSAQRLSQAVLVLSGLIV